MLKIWKKNKKDIIIFGSICIAILLFTTFVAKRTVVDGISMEPTYHDGQNLIVNKIAKYTRDINRYDVILLHPEIKPSATYIKRVIGLPGENVKIDEDGNIYINDELLKEPISYDVMTENVGIDIQLSEDEYFVLGDNRNHSADSRVLGAINIKDIVGKIIK